MNLILTGRQMKVSPRLAEFVEGKVKRLERHMPSLGDVQVQLATNPTRADEDRFSCKITTWVDHHLVCAEESAADIKRAANAAVQKLDRQLTRLRKFHQHKGRPSVAQNLETL